MSGQSSKSSKAEAAGEKSKHRAAGPPQSRSVAHTNIQAEQLALSNRAFADLVAPGASGETARSRLLLPLALNGLNSTGQPIDSRTQSYMESRFDQDFSRVRIHTGHKAERSAEAINAYAYTIGNDVVFGPGQYLPETDSGRHLLAHELAHVVQQSRGGANHRAMPATSSIEQSADRAADGVRSSSGVVQVSGNSAPGLALKEKPTRSPNFYKTAFTANRAFETHFRKMVPPGWPYDEKLRKLWEDTKSNQTYKETGDDKKIDIKVIDDNKAIESAKPFIDAIAEFQTDMMKATGRKVDGVLDPETSRALLKHIAAKKEEANKKKDDKKPPPEKAAQQKSSGMAIATDVQAQPQTQAERLGISEGGKGEIKGGLARLKAVTVGKAIEALGKRYDAKPWPVAEDELTLFDATQQVYYVTSNRVYLLDRSGYFSGSTLNVGTVTMKPGTYFVGGSLIGSASSSTAQRMYAAVRVDNGVEAGEGEVNITKVLTGYVPAKEQLSSAAGAKGGVAFIISQSLKQKGEPERNYENLVTAVRNAVKYLPWAFATDLDDRLKNIGREVLNQLISEGIELIGKRLPGVGQLIQGTMQIARYMELAEWVGKTGNIALYARTPDEIDLASQAIAKRIASELIDKLISKGISAGKKAFGPKAGPPVGHTSAQPGKPKSGPASKGKVDTEMHASDPAAKGKVDTDLPPSSPPARPPADTGLQSGEHTGAGTAKPAPADAGAIGGTSVTSGTHIAPAPSTNAPDHLPAANQQGAPASKGGTVHSIGDAKGRRGPQLKTQKPVTKLSDRRASSSGAQPANAVHPTADIHPDKPTAAPVNQSSAAAPVNQPPAAAPPPPTPIGRGLEYRQKRQGAADTMSGKPAAAPPQKAPLHTSDVHPDKPAPAQKTATPIERGLEYRQKRQAAEAEAALEAQRQQNQASQQAATGTHGPTVYHPAPPAGAPATQPVTASASPGKPSSAAQGVSAPPISHPAHAAQGKPSGAASKPAPPAAQGSPAKQTGGTHAQGTHPAAAPAKSPTHDEKLAALDQKIEQKKAEINSKKTKLGKAQGKVGSLSGQIRNARGDKKKALIDEYQKATADRDRLQDELNQHEGDLRNLHINVAQIKGPTIKPGTHGGPTAKQKFSDRVKDQAFAADPTKTCVYCARPGTATDVDHAYPREKGGDATIQNAQLTCNHCNTSKQDDFYPKTPPAGYTGQWPPLHWPDWLRSLAGKKP